MIAFVLGLALALALVAAKVRYLGFPAQKPADYSGQGPEFDLRRHLDGPILCEGVVYGPTGRVVSRFTGDFLAQWEGNSGTMTEEFRYDSGATQSRRWSFKLANDGSIAADAPDLVGSGHGMQQGSGVNLRYRIRLPEDSGGHVLAVTDWMYLMENGAIINRSQFRKFGFLVAELVATMRPKEAA
ncbi:DUF3833 family protein [Rhodovulum sulfidophilum]|uniref:DUF3833 family protein n=2 Tax=Rhodovulum sulfidophilum TaxID=35806 RepID=A0A0D6B707_RHOSU|nr:DUF3833 family protein [Rhodovulum sulfidophilum]ANB33009.1 hypothetical protein A6W98_02295 [Rhodovulum sulfidophilum DSM 1374]ANB36857.1 hypothetical protein A6024_02280 [Rhodovulum sulfidophilum]MBK5925143.1 hypothetical protein [Rhodovulum sulfidophilum]MBL3552112.1 DUF3833 family protein [Rhodovulum sulfidophilum]MBL3559933.1 DUF3833 family protein [Rhodovulum sulfidophilum]